MSPHRRLLLPVVVFRSPSATPTTAAAGWGTSCTAGPGTAGPTSTSSSSSVRSKVAAAAAAVAASAAVATVSPGMTSIQPPSASSPESPPPPKPPTEQRSQRPGNSYYHRHSFPSSVSPAGGGSCGPNPPLWAFRTAAVARCDAATPAGLPPPLPGGGGPSGQEGDNKKEPAPQEDGVGEPYYHGLFPERQLWKPKLPYPLWDKNWDGREPTTTGDKERDRERARYIRKHGVTRHIILVRHGQYDEDEKEDDKRKLTELGRIQAELTGKRLRDMIEATVGEDGNSNSDSNNISGSAAGPSAAATFSCRITALRVSDLTRAKETADIIAAYLPVVVVPSSAPPYESPQAGPNTAGTSRYEPPDPSLNEGRPCHHVPGVRATRKVIEVTDDNHRRIEGAYQRYFYRADPPPALPSAAVATDATSESSNPPFPPTTARPVQEHHEFEIIVCHANVIRYFVCRALQLPPEAWLRFCPFNCSLTYLTIRPTGSVSCRLLGDIGHIPYPLTSFSKHLGYNWNCLWLGDGGRSR